MSDTQCKERVIGPERWDYLHPTQCKFKAIKDGFCHIHHPEFVKKRQLEAQKRWEEKSNLRPRYSQVQYDELKSEIKRLKKLLRSRPK